MYLYSYLAVSGQGGQVYLKRLNGSSVQHNHLPRCKCKWQKTAMEQAE